MSRLIVGILTVAGFLVIGGNWAQAYIPPSQFILKTWVNKRHVMKNLGIKSIITAYSDHHPTDVHFKELCTYQADTQTFKSWAVDDAGRKLFYTEKKINRISPAGKLLLSKDLQEITTALKEKGIPIKTEQELLMLRTEAERAKSEKESLLRWNGGIVWAIGASTHEVDSQSPQIWFEKDTFLPLRILYAQQNRLPVGDIQFETYRFIHEFVFPRKINVFIKGEQLFSAQASDIFVDSDQFHVESGHLGFTEFGNSASNQVKKLVSSYYEFLR